MIERKDDYTPSLDHMRYLYVRHADQLGIASDHVLHAEFDRFLAAAEQRGASKAFHKTQQIIAGEFEHTIDEARERDDMINTGYLIQEIDAEIQDQMEGNDA